MSYTNYTPTAAVRDVVGMPGRQAAGAGPIRPSDGPAPSLLTIPANAARVPTPGPDPISALVDTFKGISPGLERLATQYYAQANKESGERADADATVASMKDSISTWSQAVAKDPTLADQSPWYRQIYEARLAKSAISSLSGQALAAYTSDPIANSTDPSAIKPWLQSKFAGVLDQFTSPSARGAAADELRNVTDQFVNAHQKNAARNLVNDNTDSFSSALGLSLDRWAATDGKNVGALTQTWQDIEAGAKAQGIDGRTINTTMAKSLSTGMTRLGRSDITAVGLAPRADGTPGFSTTLAGRQEMVAAQEHMLGRQTQIENLQWTREQRARQTSDRDAEGNLAGFMINQMQNGQSPHLDPSQLAPYVRSAPEAVTKALAMQRSLTSYSQQEDPKQTALALAPFYAGGGTIEDVASMGASGKFSPETVNKAFTLAAENQRDDGLKAPGVTSMIEETKNIVGNVAPITGIMQEPVKGAEAANRMRTAAMDFRKNNPTASAADQVENLRKLQPGIITDLRADFDVSPMSQFRNIRNNNYTNLTFANQPGAVPEGGGAVKMAKFDTPQAGVAADLRQYQLYQSRGNTTLEGMIKTATPPGPANPNVDKYVASVAQEMGIKPGDTVDLKDPATAIAFIHAISAQEGGRGNLQAISKGVLQALGEDKVKPTAPPTPAQEKATAERNAVVYAPRPGIDWKTVPTFPDKATLEAAAAAEVGGGAGSQQLRQWFKQLNLNTPEDQRAFLQKQRALFSK